LQYEEEDKKWLVSANESYSSWEGFEATDEFDGSDELYSPSEETVKDAKSKDIETDIEEFITDYTVASVDAINARDFDIMKDYTTEKGPRRNEAKEYINYLDSKDIYEEFIHAE